MAIERLYGCVVRSLVIQAVVVMIKHAVMFRFSNDEPCMLIKLACVDAFNDQEKNRQYSKDFIDYAAAEFSIQAQRFVQIISLVIFYFPLFY